MSPSYRIVFYISGHGFGHASRAIAVIHALLDASPEAYVVVKTVAPRGLFAAVVGPRCEIVEQQCDAGMVQVDSLAIDTTETITRAVEFQERVPELVDAEAAYLRESGAHVAVGDIPPLASSAAHAAGIPSVAIGNFTWDWIYEACRDQRAHELARDIRRMYVSATRVLRLPMAGGFAGLEHLTRDIPFITRHSGLSPDAVRQALGLPHTRSGTPIVLMAFGGHGGIAGLDTSALALMKDYVIVTSAPIARHDASRKGPGVLHIPEQLMRDAAVEFVDLVRAADVVVTKPGYSIISEAIAGGTALLYTSRGDFAEYDVLVREMPRYLRAGFIEQEQLLSGDWSAALGRLLSTPLPVERPALNGAEVAAEEILAV